MGVPLAASGTGPGQAAPTAAPVAQATATPRPSPTATVKPKSEADEYYDSLYELDRSYLQPCFVGGLACDPKAPLTLDDGTVTALGPELVRVYELFLENGSPSFSTVICREERGALFAFLAYVRARLDVLDLIGDRTPASQLVERAPLRQEACDTSLTYDGRKALAREITEVLERARTVVATAEADVPDASVDQLSRDGDRLIDVGLDLARRAARDASFEDYSAGTQEWISARSLGADMVLLGMLLRDPSTATAKDTKALLSQVVVDASTVSELDLARNWH